MVACEAATIRPKITLALRTTSLPPVCERVVQSIEAQVGIRLEEVNTAYPYAEPMTWDDARKLAGWGMTVGSHSVSHPNMTLLSSEELHSELQSSRETIQRECRTNCRHFCYPHGIYSDAVCDVARAVGYSTGVTVDSPGWNCRGTSLFRLERFPIPESAYKLPYMLTGAAEVMDSVKRYKAKLSKSN